MTRDTYARLAGFYLVYFAGIGAFSPYFAPWLASRGLDATAISLVMSLWYGARIVAPGAWSHATANSARPIAWLRGGAIATLACFALFLVPLPYAGIVAVMAAYAFFYNAIMPQFEAITLSHLRGEPGRYGRIRVWGSVGFIAVVVGFGAAFDHVPIAWLPAMMLPIFVAIVVGAYANDYASAKTAEAAAPSAPLSARDDRAAAEPLAASLRRPGVLHFLALAHLMQVAHGAFYVFFSLFLVEHGYRASAVGGYWAIGVLAEIAMFWYAGAVLRRYGTLAAMRVCLAVAAIRFIVTGTLADSALVVALAQLTHALTFGLFHASSMMRVTELFPARLVGQGQGLLYGLGSGIGGVVGALIAGVAWDHGGGDAAFVACGIAAAIGFLVACRNPPRPFVEPTPPHQGDRP